jgi:predicted DNA-binding protein
MRLTQRRGEEGMKYISVVVPEEIDRQLRFACADQATTKSRLVRKLIEKYLEEWRKEFDDKTLEALKHENKD